MNIGIYGSAAPDTPEEIKQKARAIGKTIAEAGHTVVTGACHGIPHEAVIGAHAAGGECVGFSPRANLESHIADYDGPVDGFTKIVYMPADYEHLDNLLVCLKYRNVASVAFADAAIIIGGRIGTMNEFTIAYDIGRVIGILEGSGGITDEAIDVLLRDANKKSNSVIVRDAGPSQLVKKVIQTIRQ